MLITACDVAPWIAESVRSAREQLGPDDEIVVIDDASTDGTDVVIPTDDERITVARNTRRLGSAGARNRAATLASGELYVFLDGDDVALPGRLDLHRRAAATGAQVSYGRIALIDAGGHLRGWHRATARSSPVPLHRQLTYENPIPFSAAAVTAAAFVAVGGFDEQITSSEDWEFWARLARHEGISFLPIEDHVTSYRVRRGSKSLDWREKRRAYEQVRNCIVAASESEADSFAALAFTRREALTTVSNMTRGAKDMPSPSAFVDMVPAVLRAAVLEVAYRSRLEVAKHQERHRR